MAKAKQAPRRKKKPAAGVMYRWKRSDPIPKPFVPMEEQMGKDGRIRK